MLAYKHMCTVKKWYVRVISLVLTVISATWLTAASLERTRESHTIARSISLPHIEVSEHRNANRTALQDLVGIVTAGLTLAKSCIRYARENPRKFLTACLALQSSGAVIKMLGVAAISVNGLFQNFTYDPIVGTSIRLRQIVILNTGNASVNYNAIIVLNPKDAGYLFTSTTTSIVPSFTNGTWNAYGEANALNNLFSNVLCNMVPSYQHSRSTLYLNLLIHLLSDPADKAEGIIEFAPRKTFELSGVNQTLTNARNGSPVDLPLSIKGTLFFNSTDLLITIMLDDSNAGNLTISQNSSITLQKITEGVWNASGSVKLPGSSLSGLVFTPTVSNNGVRLTFTIYEVAFPSYKEVGFIQVNPNTTAVSSIVTTTQGLISSSTATTADQMNTVATTFSSAHQNGTENDVPSSNLSALSSTTDTLHASSQDFMTIAPSDPPYAIIGGVLGGGLCLGGVIVVIVALKKGWIGRQKRLSSNQVSHHEVALEENHGALKNPQYLNVPVPAVKSHYASSVPFIKPQDNTYSTLPSAAKQGDCDLIVVHLDMGVSVDAPNEEGFTPLQLAAMEGHLAACKALIARGAHINLPCKEGKTALQLAKENGHENIVNYLLNSSNYQDLSS
jgi:hypothetical protein